MVQVEKKKIFYVHENINIVMLLTIQRLLITLYTIYFEIH